MSERVSVFDDNMADLRYYVPLILRPYIVALLKVSIHYFNQFVKRL